MRSVSEYYRRDGYPGESATESMPKDRKRHAGHADLLSVRLC